MTFHGTLCLKTKGGSTTASPGLSFHLGWSVGGGLVSNASFLDTLYKRPPDDTLVTDDVA